MYNNPFFTNFPDVGDLNWEEIIVEDTCPIFFTLISEKGQRYISVCCELYEEQRWVVAPISNAGLIKLLTNKLSMKDAFFTQSNEKCIIAHWSKDNPVLRYEIAASNELSEQDLPIDEMLEAEESEFAEYIQKIKDSESKSVVNVLASEIADRTINTNLVIRDMTCEEEILKLYVDTTNGRPSKRPAKKHKEFKRGKVFELAYNL